MKLTEKSVPITNAIKLAQKDKMLELEAVLRLGVDKTLSKTEFNRIVSYVKGIEGIQMQSVSENLDIFTNDDDDLRYSIFIISCNKSIL